MGLGASRSSRALTHEAVSGIEGHCLYPWSWNGLLAILSVSQWNFPLVGGLCHRQTVTASSVKLLARHRARVKRHCGDSIGALERYESCPLNAPLRLRSWPKGSLCIGPVA